MTKMTGPDCTVMCNLINTHTHTLTQSHDAPELDGGMCHGDGCRQEITRLHAIRCTKTGRSSLNHNRVLHQALSRSLHESKVQFVVEDTWPFRERASGQSSRPNPLRMHITTETRALFHNHPRLRNKALLLDITIVSPCASSDLEDTSRHAGNQLADAVERRKNKYWGSFPATYSFLPLAMSTCGEFGSDVHTLIKELAIRRVEHRSETHSNESQHLAEGTEVAHLRWRFAFVLQQALSFHPRHHLCRQGMALASTRQLRLQGPVSAHAHRTEGRGGVNGVGVELGVGGRIGVGGGNGDRNRVGCGNGYVSDHGDGGGAGAGTEVGASEGAQDGNGDGSGDGAGTGTRVETRRRTQNGDGDGNGDENEDSSGDGNGDEDRNRGGIGAGTGTGVETPVRTQDGNEDGSRDGNESNSENGNGDEDGNGNGNEDRIEEGGEEAKKR